jgi:hypothetical protein
MNCSNPTAEIGSITSLLTMVGGRIVEIAQGRELFGRPGHALDPMGIGATSAKPIAPLRVALRTPGSAATRSDG